MRRSLPGRATARTRQLGSPPILWLTHNARYSDEKAASDPDHGRDGLSGLRIPAARYGRRRAPRCRPDLAVRAPFGGFSRWIGAELVRQRSVGILARERSVDQVDRGAEQPVGRP